MPRLPSGTTGVGGSNPTSSCSSRPANSWNDGEQESGPAILKRLLIAGQACALAWRLMRTEGVFAEQTRAFLVRLSGRQMKRSTPVTTPALLAGLHNLFATLEILKHYSPDEPQRFALFTGSLGPGP